MRALVIAALLALPALGPALAAEDAPKELRVRVGEELPIRGFRPLCDDTSIVNVGSTGALQALKVGETTCSISVGSPLGLRQVYKVIVLPAGRGNRGGR